MLLLTLFSVVLTVSVAAAGFTDPFFANHFGRPGHDLSFDYVIIGGGTAGLAMATRLAENGAHSIAVVEAGGFYQLESGNLTEVPGYYVPNVGQPLTDWNFQTTNQNALHGISFDYPRGKTLGGSSALNGMLYQRATKGFHQAWANAVGDDAYTWDSFLPYHRKSVNYTAPDMSKRAANASVPAPASQAYKSPGGPVHVTHSNFAAPFSSWANLAMREIGIPYIQDFSSGSLIGSQYCPLTIRPDDQKRSSSQTSYLSSYLNNRQTNLKIYTHSLAKRVVFNDMKRATGVLVETAGTEYYLNATKETILSAGAFQSPQVLMVSGVGPAATLRKYGIAVVSDRPGVGQNLQDHVLIPVNYIVDQETQAILQDPAAAYDQEQMFLTNGTGILATTTADYLGWEKLPAKYRKNLSNTTQEALARYPADWPELELIAGSLQAFGYSMPKANVVFMEIGLVAPLSRGSVSISSSDTTDPPVLDVGWLSNEGDVEMAIQTIHRARDFFGAKAIQPILIGGERRPGPSITTDDQIREYVTTAINTIYHASCTCAMGRVNDTNAVIDSQARVIGVSGLRVVDASSFPFLLPGHPQATIYALAEKIADHMLNTDE